MSTTLSVLNTQGSEASTIDLDEGLIERERGDQAVHDSVVSYLARKRAGTASTKGRSDVRGTGSKPYRQKGTGRARAGTVKSPIWRGGGVTFGPSPRSFARRINRKVERLALRRAFTARVDDGDVIVVETAELDEPRTKMMVQFLERVGAGTDTLVLVDDVTANVAKAARNLPNVEVIQATAVNTYQMLQFAKIVISQAGLDTLGKRLAR